MCGCVWFTEKAWRGVGREGSGRGRAKREAVGSAAWAHGPQQLWGPACRTLASEGTTLEQASRLGDFDTAPQVMGAPLQ